MKNVIFTSKGFVNGKKYLKGDKILCSLSIFVDLTEVQKCAKEDLPTKESKED